MGESELKKALQREGDERIRASWQEAERTVAERREQIEAELKRLQEDAERTLQGEVATLHNHMLFAAKTRAMACRLHAEAALEQRLLALGREMLATLADDRAGLWQSLRRDIPDSAWAKIQVHPDDAARAEKDFPDAVPQTEASLGGGLIASTEDDRIRIDNSLRCRLHRAWPDLLPKLMEDLRELVDENETSGDDTSV